MSGGAGICNLRSHEGHVQDSPLACFHLEVEEGPAYSNDCKSCAEGIVVTCIVSHVGQYKGLGQRK